MKKAKKIIAVLLVIIMTTVLFAACEGNTGGGGANSAAPSDSSSAAPSVTVAPPPASSADSGAAQPPASGGAAVALGHGKDITKDPIKIALLTISTAGLCNRLYQMALEEQAAIYPNVTFDYMDASFDPNKQITLIEEAVAQGYDAILIEPMDPVALNDAIDAAEKAGVIVVTFNIANPDAIHTLHVAGADYPAGWEAGKIMSGMTGGEGTALILDCPAVQKPGARMGTGFEDYITQNTNIKLLEPAIGIENWSADNAQIAMRDMLTKYGPGQISMVYCSSDDIANGAMNAIEQAGRQGDGILVWGYMGYPYALEAVKAGKMAGTSFTDAYVQFASLFYIVMDHIALGLNSRTGNFSQTPAVEQPMIAVTKDNVDNIMAVSRWYS